MKRMNFFLILTFLIFSGSASADSLYRKLWAPKLSQGSLKVIFLAPYSSHLDSYELQQRFDIDGVLIPVVDNYRIKKNVFGVKGVNYWPQLCSSDKQVFSDIRKALNTDWEVIVISAYPVWSSYPEDIRESILNSVINGKTLIVASLENGLHDEIKSRDIILEEMQICRANRFPFKDSKEGFLKTFRCGSGKIFQFYCKNDIRFGYLLSSSPLQSEFEYSAARVGWLLYQAANPKVEPFIDSLKVFNQNLRIDLKNTLEPNLSLNLNVRRYDNYEVFLEKQIHPVTKKSIDIDLPYLPYGKYISEVIVSDNNGATIDWYAFFFTVDHRIGLKVNITNQIVKKGQTLSCQLVLDGNTTEIGDLDVRAQWYDNWKRLLIDTGKKAFSTNFEVNVPNESLSVINFLKITLYSKYGAEAVNYTELLMPKNTLPRDFYMLYWHSGLKGSWREQLYLNALREKGVGDVLSNCGIQTIHARSAATSNFRTIPYSTHLKGLELSKNIFNDKWLLATEQRAMSSADVHKDYGVLAYTLGDEIYIKPMSSDGRFADKPQIWREFQNYLKDLYPDIESLNKQWETHFDNFENIQFKTEKAMLSSLSNPSAWVDYRMFINDRFAFICQKMRSAIRQKDTDAIVGWDGVEQFSSYDGYDWWKITRNMEFVNTYARYIVPGLLPNKIFNGESIQSFSANAKIRSGWMNTIDYDYGGEYCPWYLLLNGWNSCGWWAATLPHPEWGAFDLNLELTPVAKDVVTTVKEIKKGPATLLAHAKKIIDPIAVYYSENNFHASTIESGVGNHINDLGLTTEFWMADNLVGKYGRGKVENQQLQLWGQITPKGHYAAASKNFYLLLQDLGFQPSTIARQQIEKNVLSESGIKILVLPFVVSMSDKEIEMIKSFVHNGGLLIADYRCGIRDLHGRLKERSELDDVFGLKRLDYGINRQRSILTAEYYFESAIFKTIFHDNIEPLQNTEVYGVHDDGSAAFLVHNYGKGKTIYLNSDLYSYDLMRKHGTENDLRELFRLLLARFINLRADFIINHKNGHPIGHTEITRFKDVNNLYYGVLPDFYIDQKQAMEVSLSFPEDRYIYDVRKHKYLGNNSLIYDVIEPGKPKLYAAVPHKIEGISVIAPAKAYRGKPVEINIVIEGEFPSASRVKVNLPDGSAPEYMSGTIYMPKGSGVFRFTPALNSPVGQWTITVKECISGFCKQHQLEME